MEKREVNNKAVSIVMLTLMLITMLSLAFDTQPVEVFFRTIYIKADGSIDSPTALISTVDNVTYTFTANINDSIVVERDNIVVDGARYTLQGTGGGNGLTISGKSNVTIRNMKIKYFSYGIYLSESSNNIISKNNITNNKFYGIYIGWGSSHNTVSGNNIKNNNNGIVLYYSSNNSFQSNLLVGNQYGFGFLGFELSHFLHSIDSSNLVDGKPVYYLISKHDLFINPLTYPEVGFLALINSTNITVEGLTMTKNRLGLLVIYTNNTKIQNNNITNNVRGIWLYNSRNNTISGNNVRMNGAGIWLSESSNNTISKNNLRMNTDGIELSEASSNKIYDNIITENNVSGIWLQESSNNRIYHNNLIDNTQQVYIETSEYANFWNDSYPSGGNYWSDYKERYPDAKEIDGSGIWDTPHVIDENNQDNYPLMGMFSDFNVTWQEEPYHVNVISNSTVSNFKFEAWFTSDTGEVSKEIHFDVAGRDGILGFCRICIPTALMNGTYTVFVSGTAVPHTLLPCSSSTHNYLYFTYKHSTQEVIIILEFPTWASVSLALVVLTFAIVIYKRRPCAS